MPDVTEIPETYMYDYNVRNVNGVLQSKSTVYWLFCYIQNLIGIFGFFGLSSGNLCQKTNIELFSRLMSGMANVESSFLFHKCCFYFRIS